MKFRRVQANKGMQPKRAKGQHWATKNCLSMKNQGVKTIQNHSSPYFLGNSYAPMNGILALSCRPNSCATLGPQWTSKPLSFLGVTMSLLLLLLFVLA